MKGVVCASMVNIVTKAGNEEREDLNIVKEVQLRAVLVKTIAVVGD